MPGFGNSGGNRGFGGSGGGGYGSQNRGGGGYGNNNQGGGGYGNNQNRGGYGNNQGGGGYGNNNQGGGYGNNNQNRGGYGNNQGGGGGYGNNNQGGGGYGNNNQGGGYGNNQNRGGYGNNNQGGGGYGNNNQGGSGFGNRGGGYGNNNQGGGYGNNQGGNNQGGGYGNNNQGGGYGNNNQGGNNQGGGFGNRGGGGYGNNQGGNNQGGSGFGNRGGGGYGNNQGGSNQGGGFGNRGGGGYGNNQGGNNQGGNNQGGNNQGGGFGNRGSGGFGNNQGGNNQGGGGFGNNRGSGGGFGGNRGSGGFGNNQGGNNQGGGGFGGNRGSGGFGNNQGGNNQGGGGFGGNRGSGGFGNNQGGNNQGGGGFGNNNQGGNNQGGGFGGNRGGGFGNNNSGGGGFGNNNNNNNNNQNSYVNQQAQQFAALPDFSDRPYGNMLLYLPEESAEDKAAKAKAADVAKNAQPAASGPTAVVRPAPPPSLTDATPAAKDARHSTLSARAVKTVSASHLKDVMHNTDVSEVFGNSTILEETFLGGATPARFSAINASSILARTPGGLDKEGLPPSAMKPANVTVQAPKLARDDYDCTPSFGTLQSLNPTALQAVRNFRVALKDGKACVDFLEPVNLTRLAIDKALSIDAGSGKVVFYPDGDAPSMGEGFRVPCRVTVNGIKADVAKLRSACRKDDAIFESYSRNTWTYLKHVGDEDNADGVARDITARPTRRRESDESSEPRTDDSDPVSSDGPPAASPIQQGGHSVLSAGGMPGASPMVLPNGSMMGASTQLPPSAVSAAVPQRPSVIINTEPQRITTLDAAPLAQQQSNVQQHADANALFPIAAAQPRRLPAQRSELAHVTEKNSIRPPPPVVIVRHTSSESYSRTSQSTSAAKPTRLRPDEFLGRSFRIGWSPSGQVAVPTFSRVADDATKTQQLEVPGVEITVRNAVSRPPAQWQATARALLQSLKGVAKVERGNDVVPKVSINLAPEDSPKPHVLAAEKLRRITDHVSAAAGKGAGKQSPYSFSTQQLVTALQLTQALFGVSSGELQFGSASEEAAYFEEKRRRQLLDWLEEVVKTDAQDDTADDSPMARVVRALLRRDTDVATKICADNNEKTLQRILCMCGHGNTVGETMVRSRLDKDESDKNRDRLIKLLLGHSDPFLSEPSFKDYKRNAKAATWKQLLGIFAFYGCAPESTSTEIINAFYSQVKHRELRLLPSYAEFAPSDRLRTDRGKDFIDKGMVHQDALLYILLSFANKEAPRAAAFHPQASSYFAHDHLTAFTLVCLFRSLDASSSATGRGRFDRDEETRTAEYDALKGFAAQLDTNEMWHWGAFALCLIEDEVVRSNAVKAYLARRSLSELTGEAEDVLTTCGIPKELLAAPAPAPVPKGGDSARKTSDSVNAKWQALEAHQSLSRVLKSFN